MHYIRACLDSLLRCEKKPFPVIVVDNGSTDGSDGLIQREFPGVKLIRFQENQGFCVAVNAGIRAADTPYVILLNNDTTVERGFVSSLTEAVSSHERCFSVGAKMVSMDRPELTDDAGDFYCALGWAFARGKGKMAALYDRPCSIFAACGGAAIYRRDVLLELGLFDETYFAYLEDMDIGYRARLRGYVNRYEPKAVVRHAGSAFSGSRYNAFKVRLSSRNNVYLIGKNMPPAQILLNAPFLAAGFLIKWLFFVQKGFGVIYARGLINGLRLCLSKEGRARRGRFYPGRLPMYARIQWELWVNLYVRIFGKSC